MPTKTREKFGEAVYFRQRAADALHHHSLEFEPNMNAFLGAARSVTFVMQKEFASVPGFREWWDKHPAKTDAQFAKFRDLRNVSVKEGSIKHSRIVTGFSFGDEGLRVKGKSVLTSPVVSFDKPGIPTTFTLKDASGERKIEAMPIHDFHIKVESGGKTIEIENFLKESGTYLKKLASIGEECERKFVSPPGSTPNP